MTTTELRKQYQAIIGDIKPSDVEDERYLTFLTSVRKKLDNTFDVLREWLSTLSDDDLAILKTDRIIKLKHPKGETTIDGGILLEEIDKRKAKIKHDNQERRHKETVRVARWALGIARISALVSILVAIFK